MVTGAGGPGAVNLCRSLLLIRPCPWILAVDSSAHFIFLALGHARHRVPRVDDVEAYLEAIEGLIQKHGIDFIMPNNSLEIEVLSAHRDRISARTFLPHPHGLRLANDKWASYQVWKNRKIPAPQTRLLTTPDDVTTAFQELRDDKDTPIWVRGAGIPGKGIGVASLPCKTKDQANQWIDYWNGWGGMIASEYLPGDNLTWMGLFKEGKLVTSQGRQRLAYVIPHVSPSGITGAPAISCTISDEKLNHLGQAAVMALDPGYHGVGFVDLKGDSNGEPRVTEFNAGRFGTTHFFYSAAGANFPEMLLRIAYGETLNVPTQNIVAPDLVWIRTLDAGPVLTTKAAVEAGTFPEFEVPNSGQWPLVGQNMADFSDERLGKGWLWEPDMQPE